MSQKFLQPTASDANSSTSGEDEKFSDLNEITYDANTSQTGRCTIPGCTCTVNEPDEANVCNNCYHIHEEIRVDESIPMSDADLEDIAYSDPNIAYCNNWLCLSNTWSCIHCGCINYGAEACCNCGVLTEVKAPFSVLTRVSNVESKGDDDYEEKKYVNDDPDLPDKYKQELKFYREKAHQYKASVQDLKRNYSSLEQQHQKLQLLSVELYNERGVLTEQVNQLTRQLGGNTRIDASLLDTTNNLMNTSGRLQTKTLGDELVKLRRENEKLTKMAEKQKYEYQLKLEKVQASHAKDMQKLSDSTNEKVFALEKKNHVLENDKEQLHTKLDNLKQHSLELSLFGNPQDKDIQTISNSMKALRQQIEDENQLVQQYKDLVTNLEAELSEARSPQARYAIELKQDIKPLLEAIEKIKAEIVATSQVIFQKRFTGYNPSEVLNNIILYTIKFVSNKWKQNVNGAINSLKGQLRLAKDRIGSLEEFSKRRNIQLDDDAKEEYKKKFMEIEKSKYPILQNLKDLDSHHAIRKAIISTIVTSDVSVGKIEELFDQYEQNNVQVCNLLTPLST